MQSLLKLEKLSKIYASSSSVAIGLSNINLEFNQGEFVTVTGSSGSGKTTLLNVISGMDSYEEGELYFNGKPTSCFSQSDWEQYRLDNISFIFQDYNIVDSFTVLENVEFALLNIENPSERRKKALELIDRVGLTSHKNHKGSKLSGGQKQRTVIARALAKDSPIILADEPTGNLDTKSAKEIVQLLKEISDDKLVVVVTHNEEQFLDVATRRIRLFDGQVELDEVLVPIASKEVTIKSTKAIKNDVKNGIFLGAKRFTSKPKLTTFMCIMFLIAFIGSFFICATINFSVFKDKNACTYMPGRVIISKIDGSTITDSDLASIKNTVDVLDVDNYLDIEISAYTTNRDTLFSQEKENVSYGYTGSITKGRYPSADNELFIVCPKYKENTIDLLLNKQIKINDINCTVVGYKTILDNTKGVKYYFTKEGLISFSKISIVKNKCKYNADSVVQLSSTGIGTSLPIEDYNEYNKQLICFDDTLEKGEILVYYNGDKPEDLTTIKINTANYQFNVEKATYELAYSVYDVRIYISRANLEEAYDALIQNTGNYQASVFYKNDSIAKKEAKNLIQKGYMAVVSNETIKSNDIVLILSKLTFVAFLIVVLLFLSSFIVLCTKKTIEASKSDLAIFRSMGINKTIIKISTYVHNFICAIISYVVIVVAAMIMYNTKFAININYLHWQFYLILFAAMLVLVSIVSYKFNQRLFNESVRKNLRRTL